MGARFALARQQGLTEELVAELPDFENSQKLTDREKAAIRFADILAGDHRQASEATFDTLREYFTEGEIVDLGFRIVTFVGYGRLIHALGLEIGKTCPI
jgi:alkylhydroperoxidase family enzyme